MHTYNITWNDKDNPSLAMKGCNINADNLTELEKKFTEKHPNGFIHALAIVHSS